LASGHWISSATRASTATTLSSLPETNDGEVAAGQLDAVVLVDEVENCSRDRNQDLLNGQQRGRGVTRVRVLEIVVVREEVLDEVPHVDGGIEI
jgi:hypothetical protein